MNEANTLNKTEFDYEIPEFNPSVIVMEKELTSEEMSSLFSKVSNKEHWKGEIHAVIPAKDFNKYCQAVSHFTGGLLSAVENEDENGMIEVCSEGYWANIGA